MESKLETINLPHLPSSLPIHVALFRDVKNSAFLRQQLLAGNADFEYAMVDASLVREYLMLSHRSFQSANLKKNRYYQERTRWRLFFGQ